MAEVTRLPVLAWTFLLLAVLACSSPRQADVSSPTPDNVSPLIPRGLAAMDALDSYRMEITFSPEGEPITTIVDFARPGDYHYTFVLDDDADEVLELIEVGDLAYSRSCDSHPDDCEEWEQGQRPPLSSLGGLTTFVPETLGFVALELATGPTSMDSEVVSGEELFHLRASVNLPSAICENKRRAFAAAGIEGIESELEEECSDTSLERVPSSRVDVWLFSDDLRIHRVRIGVPGFAPDPYLETTYSRFNEVSVEPPR